MKIYLLLLFLSFSLSYRFPVQRQKEIRKGYLYFSPYTVNISLSDTEHYNLALDTTSKFVILFCCSPTHNLVNCVNTSRCESVCPSEEQDGECQHWFRQYRSYHSKIKAVEKDYYLKVDKQQMYSNFSYFHSGVFDLTDIFKEVEVDYTSEGLFNNTEGVLGLSYSFLNNSLDYFLRRRFNASERWFGLNFGGRNGTLVLGKPDILEDLGNSTISWSRRDYYMSDIDTYEYYYTDILTIDSIKSRYSSAYTYWHVFEVHDLSICGHKIIRNGLKGWTGVINTNIEGIGMPYEFWSSVKVWVQWEKALNRSVFPVLEFSVTEGGEVFEFPLQELLEVFESEGNGTNSQFFMYNRNPLEQVLYEITYNGQPFIHFGNRFIQQFYTVVDMHTHRVGLVKKYDNKVFNESEVCTKMKKCVGETIFDQFTNTCLLPQCEMYAFQISLGDGQCSINLNSLFLLLVVIILFITIDWILVELNNCFITVFKTHSKNPIIG